MNITPLVKKGHKIIQSYKADGFRVSGELYKGPIIVFSDQVKEWSIGQDVSLHTLDEYDPLFLYSQEIDFVLLGTGKNIQFLKPLLKNSLKQKGLLIEAMDTGAACRTYNMLMAEGRRVCLACLPDA